MVETNTSEDPKFVVKKCPCLMDSIYADGRESSDECGNSIENEKCSEFESCPIRQAVKNLLKVVKDPACRRCDGCGYEEGCGYDECGTYAAYKSLELLGVEVEK